MVDRLGKQVKKIVKTTKSGNGILKRYLKRVSEGELTRDENPVTHFCVYFAAFDPNNKEVFIGHHKKSGLWLFNGGHIDKGETADEALRREISEEWGIDINLDNISPSLLTITEIVSNPNGRPCKEHYDIWHLIPVGKDNFLPEKEKLDTEFYTTKWANISDARALVTDPCTIEALGFLEKTIWQNGK